MKNLTIFVAGNYAPVVIQDHKYQDFLLDIQNKTERDWFHFIDDAGSIFHIRMSKIDGWYLRDPYPDTQRELLEIARKQAAKDDGGDEWKAP